VQNRTGKKRIVNNIMFNGFSFGIHAYTQSNFIDNLKIRANTSFNHGVLSVVSGYKANILVGGGDVADNLKVVGNSLYATPGEGGRGADLDYGNGCSGAVVRKNYAVADAPIEIANCIDVTMRGNTSVGAALPPLYPNNTYLTAPPTGLRVTTKRNAYEPGRAHVTIYNWDGLTSVAYDPGQAGIQIGERFQIRDAQNFFRGPIVSGTYTGATVNIPMTGLTVARPIGNVPYVPPHTAPEFGVFVVLGQASGA
jgi:hypothetical protein